MYSSLYCEQRRASFGRSFHVNTTWFVYAAAVVDGRHDTDAGLADEQSLSLVEGLRLVVYSVLLDVDPTVARQ